MPGKALGMTVEIPGEAKTGPRKGDVNRKEYERNARVADALQKCMGSPSEILDKAVSLTATDVEEYYKERLEKNRATGDPKLNGMFDRLEKDLKEALAAIDASSEHLEKARRMDISQIPGIDLAAAKLAHLQQALDGIESEDVITSFVSDKASKRVREAAAKGNLVALQQVEGERKTWPPYMVMSSWDFADHRGDTAIHLAAKNGHAECLEFLLMRGAQPSLVNAQGHSALHVAATYEIAKMLLKHGADPVVLDKMGRTPYDVHKANRMGGARSVGGKLVLDAFAVGHQQVTGHDASRILKERNMSPEDKAARAAAQKAAEDAQAAAKLEAERTALAKSSYNQGLGALVLKEFDTAVSSFVTCLQNDRGHAGAMLKLAKMAASGEGNAAAELERLHAENEAVEAAEARVAAAASAAVDTAAAISEIRQLQPEPEVLLEAYPSRPSLDGRAATPIVPGASPRLRTVLHSVHALPLSPMVTLLSQGRQSSLVPTPPQDRSSNSVPTLSPRAPPAAPSGRRTFAFSSGRAVVVGGTAASAQGAVKLGGMTMLGSGSKQHWGQVKVAFRVRRWEKPRPLGGTTPRASVARRAQATDWPLKSAKAPVVSASGSKLPPIGRAQVHSSQSAR